MFTAIANHTLVHKPHIKLLEASCSSGVRIKPLLIFPGLRIDYRTTNICLTCPRFNFIIFIEANWLSPFDCCMIKSSWPARFLCTSYLTHLPPPSSAYMRQWSWPALVQIMACRLFGWVIVKWTFGNKPVKPYVGGSLIRLMATIGDVWIVPSFRIWDYVLHVVDISCVITNCGQHQWVIPTHLSIPL